MGTGSEHAQAWVMGYITQMRWMFSHWSTQSLEPTHYPPRPYYMQPLERTRQAPQVVQVVKVVRVTPATQMARVVRLVRVVRVVRVVQVVRRRGQCAQSTGCSARPAGTWPMCCMDDLMPCTSRKSARVQVHDLGAPMSADVKYIVSVPC